ncbi:MAG: beta-lactamase family protein [Oscillospiraceae bacterium]|nr:beta-lactamase family protein [Oscillospiraceae bacterium]
MTQQFQSAFSSFADLFSGACLVSGGDGVIFSAANGLANRDFNIPNTIDTMFDTASVTKTFTAAAILLLAEKGLLQLDDKIADIIDLSGTEIPSDVTIEQLLNHTSGIADDADEEAGEDYSALFINKPNYSIRNCVDFLPQFAYKKPKFKAGTDVRYNNCAFILLGLAIEKITGTDYRTFVTEKIFTVCGMKHTRFYAKDEISPNAAEGYFAVKDENGVFIKWKKNIYSYPPIGTPDGGAYTTVGDLDIFIRAIRDCKLLTREYSDIMMKPHCEFTRRSKYGIWRTGYAFEFIEIEAENKIFCMYKEGGNPGVDAIFSYYPELNISLNILSNQSNGVLWQIYRKMQDILFEAAIKINQL